MAIERPGGRDADQLVRHRVPGSQHAVALASRGPPQEQPPHTPQAAQERPLNKVGGIDEEHVALFRPGLLQQWLQRAVQKLGLGRRVLFDGFLRRQRDGRGAAPFQTQTLFKNRRT